MSEHPKTPVNFLNNPSHLCFTGLFLTAEQRDLLLGAIPSVFENIYADHITESYYGNDPNPPSAESIPVGDTTEVNVLGLVTDYERQVQTALVDVSIPGKEFPHITISTGTQEDGQRVPPFLSNEAIEAAVKNGTVQPVQDVKLKMVTGYCLGNYDGGRRTIVTSKDG